MTRPHRLTVRTPDSHSGNRGSIPLEAILSGKEKNNVVSELAHPNIAIVWNHNSSVGFDVGNRFYRWVVVV